MFVILDLIGAKLTTEDINRLKNPLVGGIILFKRNYENYEQLSYLTQEIKKIAPHCLITVDHEGGRVQRFRDGFTRIPSMSVFKKMGLEEACKTAVKIGFTLAAELRSAGVDLSFTPVLDLDYEHSGVIGDRSFGRDPQYVAMITQNLILGLRIAGMRSCGKHFPGHGYVSADSHTDIPIDNRSYEQIYHEDMAPYRYVTLDSVMPAHVIYPKVDDLPAGFSKKWLNILRDPHGINFQGVIFSDDLTMEGASSVGDIVKRGQLALEAGCDIILVCNNPQLADQVLQNINYTPSEASIQRWKNLFPDTPALSLEEVRQHHLYWNDQKTIQTQEYNAQVVANALDIVGNL